MTYRGGTSRGMEGGRLFEVDGVGVGEGREGERGVLGKRGGAGRDKTATGGSQGEEKAIFHRDGNGLKREPSVRGTTS